MLQVKFVCVFPNFSYLVRSRHRIRNNMILEYPTNVRMPMEKEEAPIEEGDVVAFYTTELWSISSTDSEVYILWSLRHKSFFISTPDSSFHLITLSIFQIIWCITSILLYKFICDSLQLYFLATICSKALPSGAFFDG